MNRRHNSADIRLVKKENKEIRKGMKKETVLEKKKIAVNKTLAEAPLKRHKKISKRTSPAEGIENSAPSHLSKEGKRWVSTLKIQTSNKTVRMNRKGVKYKG